jgi:sterol desaturase/sphingolipid hydroxylase (fatty acid hydroxylase superfamily)
MIIAMPIYTFSLGALVSLPVLSILFNTIGHANYNVFANTGRPIYSAGVEHGMHHRRVAGNYGFYLPMLDRWFGTSLSAPRKAAQ